MVSVVRMARHHPDYLVQEYKPLVVHVMGHVKNLRSQVTFHITALLEMAIYIYIHIWNYPINVIILIGVQSRCDDNGRTISSS